MPHPYDLFPDSPQAVAFRASLDPPRAAALKTPREPFLVLTDYDDGTDPELSVVFAVDEDAARRAIDFACYESARVLILYPSQLRAALADFDRADLAGADNALAIDLDDAEHFQNVRTLLRGEELPE